MAPALELKQIRKRFGSVEALSGADFVVQRGRVHALLGENGAGKSTLMHIANGMLAPDGGQLLVDGQPAAIHSPRDARARGIGMVHQHFTSIPALTVAENLQLFGGRRGDAASPAGLERLWRGLRLEDRVETLSVALKQQLEIVKAVVAGASILLLDEPTAVLAPDEVKELVAAMRAFAAAGHAVVFITHKLDEVFLAADEVTVLRHGRVVLTGPLPEVDTDVLTRAMMGTTGPATPDPGSAPVPAAGTSGDVVVRLDQVTVTGLDGRGAGLRGATLEVRAGELVGVVGVEGNGQRELLLVVAGVLEPAAGRREVEGAVALIPEDRTTEGLIPELSLTENLVLGAGEDAPWRRGIWVDWHAAGREAATALARHGIVAPGPHVPARMLSGGNQQKLVLARALRARPKVLVAENPARGLDLRATAAIQTALREAAGSGVAVLVYSTDLDEVLALGCSRLLVMLRGEVTEVPASTSREEIGRRMLAVVEAAP
jgi:simple sugar transport system ATP-binding protein